MWVSVDVVMASGTRGKLAEETDKVFDELKQTIIDSVQDSIATQLQGVKDLISKAPDGVDPRLTELEKVVVSADNSLQKTVTEIQLDLVLLKESETAVDKLQSLEFEQHLNNLCDVVGVVMRRCVGSDNSTHVSSIGVLCLLLKVLSEAVQVVW